MMDEGRIAVQERAEDEEKCLRLIPGAREARSWSSRRRGSSGRCWWQDCGVLLELVCEVDVIATARSGADLEASPNKVLKRCWAGGIEVKKRWKTELLDWGLLVVPLLVTKLQIVPGFTSCCGAPRRPITRAVAMTESA